MSDQSSTSRQDEITLLVFKGNLAARTFRVPLRWVSHFGILASVLLFASSIGLFWGLRYIYLADRADPQRVQELEDRVRDLTQIKSQLETKLSAIPAPAVTAIPTMAAAAPAPNPPGSSESVLQQMLTPASSLVFHALPSNTTPPPVQASARTVLIDSPQASWRGKTLHVRFNIKYSKEDQGNQQGRIIILARGPETLLAYPEGVLNTADHESLLNPDKGEFFSVARFRATQAQFNTHQGAPSLREVEILLISDRRQLILHETFPVNHAGAVAEEPVTAPPATMPKEPSRKSTRRSGHGSRSHEAQDAETAEPSNGPGSAPNTGTESTTAPADSAAPQSPAGTAPAETTTEPPRAPQ